MNRVSYTAGIYSASAINNSMFELRENEDTLCRSGLLPGRSHITFLPTRKATRRLIDRVRVRYLRYCVLRLFLSSSSSSSSLSLSLFLPRRTRFTIQKYMGTAGRCDLGCDSPSETSRLTGSTESTWGTIFQLLASNLPRDTTLTYFLPRF